MQKILFHEEQRFTQVWLWILLAIAVSSAIIPLAAALYVQLVEGRPYGDNPTHSETLLIIFFVLIVISSNIILLF